MQQSVTELASEIVSFYGISLSGGTELGANEYRSQEKHQIGVMQDYFNTRKVSIYAGSNEIQRNIMAKLVLGL